MNIALELFIIFSISLAINMTFFVLAFMIQKDLFTDITYASTFPITLLAAMLLSDSFGINSIISLIIVGAWSIRLGTFLFIRILKEKVDHRFDKMRNNFYKFFFFWIIQAVTVFIVSLPSYFVVLLGKNEFNLFSLIGIIGTVLALTFETIADAQKFTFLQRNKGQFIQKGLWKISRHPNYFGEYTFWIFNFVFVVLATSSSLVWISILGPLFIMMMLYKVSGLPMLEKGMWRTFKNNPEYLIYVNKTPRIIPFIGLKGMKRGWMDENIGG
ncbi:DUF1295 domain-containing protein [Mycoplasma todarodis]|uniref:Steroid 5-alpha reductase C-terminal domain-containing protein n=1 Tax=Mycoplasma todarodis TaxID=1937191 RepID=A0A4R0XLL8_9MOLU|nr:DUF1295 domain-containing protein [Mycoplasma todarodis]TCG11563.1 hypothetical protein C4B25_01115 [Mycoplasma todarodis]